MTEFRTGCHVVHDNGVSQASILRRLTIPFTSVRITTLTIALCFLEFAHHHCSFGLATMTCFVPSLPTRKHYFISIHSWHDPEVSQFTRSYSKHPELVQFEARIIVDGRLIAFVIVQSLSVSSL